MKFINMHRLITAVDVVVVVVAVVVAAAARK